MKAIAAAALGISLLLAGATVALAQQQTSAFALLSPSPTPTPPQVPQVLPQLNPEYFNPFPYNPDVDSPLEGVRIDFAFLARSVVTVINMVSAGGYLTWIAAFAVIFMILLAFINYILKRIRG